MALARRDHDGAEVAIKYLSDELRADVGFVARFRHEARLLGTMRSPHNARLIDYFETGTGAAIVMELVNGASLRELLRSEGPTGPEAALTVLKGSLQGLAAAHAMGVVHRDFKPENVIVQGDGDSKLVDFGIAVMAGEGASAAGTPPYMAPEQWAGAPRLARHRRLRRHRRVLRVPDRRPPLPGAQPRRARPPAPEHATADRRGARPAARTWSSAAWPSTRVSVRRPPRRS